MTKGCQDFDPIHRRNEEWKERSVKRGRKSSWSTFKSVDTRRSSKELLKRRPSVSERLWWGQIKLRDGRIKEVKVKGLL